VSLYCRVRGSTQAAVQCKAQPAAGLHCSSVRGSCRATLVQGHPLLHAACCYHSPLAWLAEPLAPPDHLAKTLAFLAMIPQFSCTPLSPMHPLG
jgi:hypothetical protein